MYLPVIAALLLHNCIGQEQVRMTLVSLNHFYSEVDSEYQCHLSDPDFSDENVVVDSVRIQNTRNGNDNNPIPPDPMYQGNDDYPHYKIAMVNNNNNNAFGVFGCGASKNREQETVISTTRMRADADIVPSNELFTQTVNIGDRDVTISMMSPTGSPVADFRWRKDGSTGTMNRRKAILRISRAIELNDGGVYECHINGDRDEARQGLNLLIVRACPVNRWDPPVCDGVCDSCYNGGICDENNGRCVCPPGFKGNNCLEACGGNTFGHTCEKKCLSDGNAGSCRDRLFCLVHPFGCRCNTGWRGLACNTVCDANTFGASCLQSCSHCASNQCNRYTGRCTGPDTSCDIGWTGDNCQECDGNFFGTDCTQECHCSREHCNTESGLCKAGGCLPQWVDLYPPYSCQTGLTDISTTKVNTGAPAVVYCTAIEGTEADLDNFELVLSRDYVSLENADIIAGNREDDDTTRTQSFTINSAEGGDVLYCQLRKDGEMLAVLNITLDTFVLPVLASSPLKEFVNFTTITISWLAWNETKDEGDGPVVGYIPYFKETGEDNWIQGDEVSSEVLVFTATSLKPSTEYSFSVAAVREGDGGEGAMSPVLNVGTQCYVPPSPENVAADISGDRQELVEVSWQLPSEGMNCHSGVTRFTIYYSSSETELISLNVTDPTATTFILSDLTPGVTYTLYVTLSTSGGESSGSIEVEYLVPVATSTPASIIAVSIVVPVLFIILVLLAVVLVVKRRNSGKSQEAGKSGKPNNYFTADVGLQDRCSKDNVQATEDEDEDSAYNEDSAYYEDSAVYSNLEKPVSIMLADLEYYISNCENSKTENFRQQFMVLNGNKQFESNVGNKTENKEKNRFKNLKAYDHSRVVLDTLEGDPHSDYYNANYVKNVEREVAFIASQAPNRASVNDFWRMVSKEKVCNIVMLTNLVEGGKDRCIQYWPGAVGETKWFADIQVKWKTQEQFADYDIRELHLTQGQQRHKVTNWHFKTWPDKDVPHQVSPLLAFVNKVYSAQQTATGHLLVHCSAGVGRTGTFIAIYSLTDLVKAGTRIDIYGFVEQMRQDRVNMVQTVSQYKFVHECLLEAFLVGDTKIPVDSISCFDASSQKDRLKEQFQLLRKLDQRCPKSHTATSEESEKDRYPEIIPVDKQRPYLQSPGKTSSSIYINACFVSSYRKKNTFIATQSPLPNTVEDFWRLVYDQRCPLIVMLNQLDSTDQTCCKYWPDSGSSQIGHMKVEFKDEQNMECYVYRQFDVTHTLYQETRSVHHMQLTSWNESNLTYVISLIHDMEILQQDYNMVSPTVVHCINGVGRTGVFLAAKSEMERVDAEQNFDVFSTVRQLRGSNTGLVYTEEEYYLCHQLLASTFSESHYANI